MKPHLLSNTRHIALSRQAKSSVDPKTPKPVPPQPDAPTGHRNSAPSAHSEKMLSRRMHRKQATGYIGTSLSWLDKSRLRGDGPVFLRIGGRIVYDTAELDAYLAAWGNSTTRSAICIRARTGAG